MQESEKRLLEVLESLCDMWHQYCGGEWGHECMSAGEGTQDVLDKYNLLIQGKGYAASINEEQLEKYRQEGFPELRSA